MTSAIIMPSLLCIIVYAHSMQPASYVELVETSRWRVCFRASLIKPILVSAGVRVSAGQRTPCVTTIELVVTTVESVRDSKSERTSLLNDTIVSVKL